MLIFSPHSSLEIPFPSRRLAEAALRSLQVDSELSPSVHRTLRLGQDSEASDGSPTTLIADYHATTNRMLRVSVNGFMESMKVILGVMEELDVDALEQELSH